VEPFDRGDDDVVEAAGERLGVLGGDGDLQDREVVERDREHGRVDVLGQEGPHAPDRLVHLLLDARDLGPVLELREHERDPGRRRPARALQARHGLQRLLERSRDVLRDDLGRGTRVARDDREGGDLERGDELLLERAEGDRAEHGRHDGDERDEGAVLEGELGELVHGVPVRSAWVGGQGARSAKPWRTWSGPSARSAATSSGAVCPAMSSSTTTPPTHSRAPSSRAARAGGRPPATRRARYSRRTSNSVWWTKGARVGSASTTRPISATRAAPSPENTAR